MTRPSSRSTPAKHCQISKSRSSIALTAVPDDLRYSLTNAEGKETYPISGTVWAVVYTNQPKDKGQAIYDFLHWVTHDGQQFAKGLHYASLPSGLVERLDKKLSQ